MKNAPHAGQTRAPHVAVLLAGGAGTRFRDSGHKLLAQLTKQPDGTEDCVFSRSLSNVVQADIGPVVVVTGSLSIDDLRTDPTIDGILTTAAANAVVIRHNPAWRDGQSTSLQVGIDAARSLGATSITFGLADQPFVTSSAWRAVATGPGTITVATYDDRRGNPVRFNVDVWGLLPTTGDEGGRVLMRSHPELVTEVPCTGSPADIDTVEDLHRWQNN
jgi:CTP:molybdopterin cytidylyltransferase MocA